MEWPGNIRQLKNLIERVLILGNPSKKISNELVLSGKSQDQGKKLSNFNKISQYVFKRSSGNI